MNHVPLVHEGADGRPVRVLHRKGGGAVVAGACVAPLKQLHVLSSRRVVVGRLLVNFPRFAVVGPDELVREGLQAELSVVVGLRLPDPRREPAQRLGCSGLASAGGRGGWPLRPGPGRVRLGRNARCTGLRRGGRRGLGGVFQEPEGLGGRRAGSEVGTNGGLARGGCRRRGGRGRHGEGRQHRNSSVARGRRGVAGGNVDCAEIGCRG
mmetsp:Transcript_14498/g.54818  ORF Transcript_14498/g.54818 Transcript_14498/m.54818 type:complete len:209 (-) Transcript_14498:595-1221(-)